MVATLLGYQRRHDAPTVESANTDPCPLPANANTGAQCLVAGASYTDVWLAAGRKLPALSLAIMSECCGTPVG